jgi:hypothetical protein
MNKLLTATFGAAAGMLLSVAAQAQIIDASPCIAIEDAARRLDCYDAAASRAQSSAAAAPMTSAPIVAQAPKEAPQQQLAEAQAPAATSSDPLFAPVGVYKTQDQRREEKRASKGADDEDDDKQPIPGIEARLADFERQRDGMVIITLDNGQVWRQTTGGRMRVVPGRDLIVQIEKSAFGGYWMTIERAGGAVRAERVK